MNAQKTLAELIETRKAASDEMDNFFLSNRPFDRSGYFTYFLLTQRYLAALNEEMKARTCLAPTWEFYGAHNDSVKAVDSAREY